MMSREDLQFDQMMKQLGVRPLRERAAVKPPEYQTNEADDSAADAEFAAAMAELETAENKDAAPRSVARTIQVREVRYSSKANLHIQSSLDLHGKHQEEAIGLLSRFIRQCREDRMLEVAVITGKGHHSHGGVPVLKPLVREWALTDGRYAIATIGEAPRMYGGAGVWIITLRIAGKP